MRTTSAPIKRAVVQHFRGDAPLKAFFTGGFHEAFAPENVRTPFLVYNFVVAPYSDTWGSRLIVALVDVFSLSEKPVAANNGDQLILNSLDGAELTVDGQSTLICRRAGDLPVPPSLDSEGKKIYQIGGMYEIWTDQPL
jgi:hypothetical protein